MNQLWNRNELLDLLDALCNDKLASGDHERLEGLLTENADAQHVYFDYLDMHLQLRRWRKVEGQRAELPVPVSPFISPLPNSFSPSFVDRPVFSYMVASVVLCVMLLSAWAYKITHDQEFVDNRPARKKNVDSNGVVFVGIITGTTDCRWTNPDTSTILGAFVSFNRKYALSSGLMEITYTSGSRVILEGPCEFEVNSNAGGYLHLGKLTARIKKRGENREGGREIAKKTLKANSPVPLFTVTTPTAVVTDLGTEFGVKVSEDGDTYTQVFSGSVKVRLVGDGRSNDLVLRENESARVIKSADGDKSSIIKLNADEQSRFVREMSSLRPMSSNAYAELVLSLDPVLFYRMEQPSGEGNQRLVRDSAPSGNHGTLLLGDEFGGTPYRPGRFGDAISLRGPDVRDHVLVKNYPKARENRLTVAAWVMATGRPGWAMIAANWGQPSVKGQFHLGLFQRDGDLSVSLRQRDGKQVDLREGTEQPFPLFGWQFVAFVADGDMVKLYRDGKLVASTACKGIYAETPLSGLGIGCKMNDEGTGAPVASAGYHYWQGRIDELAIFNRALSDEQIKLLFTGKQINKNPDNATAKKGE